MNYQEMITHTFFGGHDITIIPVCDVHFGAEECMEAEFRRFVYNVANTENVYFTLGGDLIDNGTPCIICPGSDCFQNQHFCAYAIP